MSACRTCSDTYVGKQTHCTRCHRTFSTHANFDRHLDPQARCLDPEAVVNKAGERLLVVGVRGKWCAPGADFWADDDSQDPEW